MAARACAVATPAVHARRWRRSLDETSVNWTNNVNPGRVMERAK